MGLRYLCLLLEGLFYDFREFREWDLRLGLGLWIGFKGIGMQKVTEERTEGRQREGSFLG